MISGAILSSMLSGPIGYYYLTKDNCDMFELVKLIEKGDLFLLDKYLNEKPHCMFDTDKEDNNLLMYAVTFNQESIRMVWGFLFKEEEYPLSYEEYNKRINTSITQIN